MADVTRTMQSEGFSPHTSFHFDRKNPRTPDQEFTTEDKVLDYLVKHADVDELVTSMQSSGWVDFEPLIVQRSDSTVLEGNRRLAALRLLTDPAIRERLGYKLPNDGSIPDLPEKVRVRWVDDRAEARSFIAFKHINGPFKWDALAKAKYAAIWLDEGEQAAKVARQIGDTHNTVLRLVNGCVCWNRQRRMGLPSTISPLVDSIFPTSIPHLRGRIRASFSGFQKSQIASSQRTPCRRTTPNSSKN